MSAHLYINSKGRAVTRHSFSGGSDFSHCAQFYKLKRTDGWTEKELHAYFEFGKAVEAGWQFYHENGLDLAGAINAFFNGYLKAEGWNKQKDKPLTYTAVEGDWDALAASGREMIQLYALTLPFLPIAINPVPKFQTELQKEVFPSTKLAGIEFVAYIDMIAQTDWRRLLGPNPDPATMNPLQVLDQKQKILVDCKTAAKPLPKIVGIAGMSKQLKTYSWLADISQVAFLRFIKTNRSFERGSEVILLEDLGNIKSGTTVQVIKYQEFEPTVPEKPADPAKPRSKPKPAIPEQPEELWIVREVNEIAQMFKICGSGQTREEKENRETYIKTNAALVDKTKVTKQRIEFVRATISKADQQEMATKIGREIAAIHNANETDYWPKEGDITYPNDKCPKCPMLGLCLNNPSLRDEKVERKDQLSEFD